MSSPRMMTTFGRRGFSWAEATAEVASVTAVQMMAATMTSRLGEPAVEANSEPVLAVRISRRTRL